MITDLSNDIMGAADLDSDEEGQTESSGEDRAKEDNTIRDKYCRDAKKSIDFCAQQCNTEDNRLPCSVFDAA